MNDRAVGDPVTTVDLAEARKLLDSLSHLSPAQVQMLEISKRDPKPGAHLTSREKQARHRSGVGNEEPGRSRWSDLQGARPPGTNSSASLTLVTDYADGLTQVQIAKKRGLHVQTVRKRLIEAGVDTRARLRVLSDEDLGAARAAMDKGASIREIARGLGVAHTTVIRSLARRHEASGSPSRTTRTRSRSRSTPVRARRSPWCTTPKTDSDQGEHKKQTGPSIEMLGPDPG
jgi:transposase